MPFVVDAEQEIERAKKDREKEEERHKKEAAKAERERIRLEKLRLKTEQQSAKKLALEQAKAAKVSPHALLASSRTAEYVHDVCARPCGQ